MLKKWFLRILLFIAAFAFITQMIPQAASTNEPTTSPLDIIFYSDYKYQTINPKDLNQISRDFYVPVFYEGVELTYVINSEYLDIKSQSQTISLRTNDGFEDKDVYHVEIIKTPSIWRQQADFDIQITYTIDGQLYEDTYHASINALMPDDFLGGTVFTIIKYGGMFLEGALKTLILALVGTLAGFILAMFLVTFKLMEVKDSDSKFTLILKKSMIKISSLYITIFRGTPMIVQASFFWYGFGLFGDPFYCGLFVVSINTAAYIAEILRGGIQSIDPGQKEAARSLGMTHTQVMVFVIFPQAIKNALPAIGNEFIVNIKDTAVLSVIGIFELFNQGRKITGMHYRQLEVYLIVALIYLTLTYGISTILKHIERRMDLTPLEITSSN